MSTFFPVNYFGFMICIFVSVRKSRLAPAETRHRIDLIGVVSTATVVFGLIMLAFSVVSGEGGRESYLPLLCFLAGFMQTFASWFVVGPAPHATDDDTFAYIAWRYDYPVDTLRRDVAAYGLCRFPVRAFEAQLDPQLVATPGCDRRALVERYLGERRDAWERARQYTDDVQLQRDSAELVALTDPNEKTVYFCDWECVRQMELARVSEHVC